MDSTLPPSFHDEAPVERKHWNGIGTAALWVGIAACFAAFFPLTSISPVTDIVPNNGIFTWPTMIVGGILGVSLGMIGMRKTSTGRATNRTTAKVGLTLSVVALEVCTGWVVLNVTNMPG
jgi:hypothetical protein